MDGFARMVIEDPSKMSLLTTEMKKQIVTAAISTVNIQSAKTRKNAIENIGRNFVNRNSFTKRNITFTPCPLGSVHTLANVEARVGAGEPVGYMERQEKGGAHEATGNRLNIPTDAARGGDKKRPVSKMYRMDALSGRFVVTAFSGGRAKGRAGVVAGAYIAYTKNKLLFYKGSIFKITRFYSYYGVAKFEKKMIYNRKFSVTQTAARPWLQPAGEKPAADCQNIFNHEMDKLATK
jgi:hypothetical protein